MQALLEYNCNFSKYEGFAINKGLYDLTKDLTYISRKLTLGSPNETTKLYTGTILDSKCRRSCYNDSGALDLNEDDNYKFGYIIKTIINCLKDKTVYDDTLGVDLSEQQNEIKENLKSLQIITFKVLHLS